MPRLTKGLLLGLAAVLTSAPPSLASDIRVRPVTVDVPMGAATTNVVVSNGGSSPGRVQFRVMRWTQVDGRDVLAPTEDVVISPPQALLEPNTPYTVRIVRTAAGPTTGEESYRLLVDGIPDPSSVFRSSGVDLVVQQRLPVFFSNQAHPQSIIDWSLDRSDGKTWLRATNRGNRYLRLADVRLRQGDQIVGEVGGLVGYVLAGSTMRWPIDIRAAPGGAPIVLEAQSNGGRIQASLTNDEVR